MTDARTAAVEHSLDSFAEALARSPLLTRGEEPDVLTYYCEKPFPMLNVIAAARFAPGAVERRAREVAKTFLDRGLPFMWWSTPSGHADELRPILTGLGMHCEEVPGMCADLDGPVDLLVPDGVDLRPVSRGELDPTVDVTLAGFGIPAEYAEDFRVPLDRMLADGMVQVTAWLDGEPVASGSAWITGETVGLYNITSVERARGRGIGYAVTAALMNAGRELGCTHAVLHASDMGYPVYTRLGFETVCQVPQFVWMPQG